MKSIVAWLLTLLLLMSGMTAAEDAIGATPPALVDFFDAARAPKPVPGQWIEYRVGYPVDPLENSLQPESPGAGSQGEIIDLGDGYSIAKPSFDPGVAWEVLPLRIEVRQVTPEGCNIFLTFDGASHRLFLAANSDKDQAELRYDPPKKDDDVRFFIKMGNGEFEVERIRRRGAGYGFVRYFCPEVPFGVFRFATADVDLVMVGFGQGRPPEFPITVEPPIEPPLGQLYGR